MTDSAPRTTSQPEPLSWPTNTAAPPPGWHRLTDTDATTPIGWFSTVRDGMRTVARAYPTWDDARFDLDEDDRVPLTAEQLDYDPMDIYLHSVFAISYRGYVFPDTFTDGHAATGPATHRFSNLDFVGGWQPPLPPDQYEDALLARTLSGAKPTATLIDYGGHREEWIAAAQDAGLHTGRYTMGGLKRLWVAPERLGDRVDRDQLTAAWQALLDADPNPDRRQIIEPAVHAALPAAFDLDLLAPFADSPTSSRLLPPWWDEDDDEGLIVLGAVLGYPPATTYAVLSEWNGLEEDVPDHTK